jgi:hypothetical protein
MYEPICGMGDEAMESGCRSENGVFLSLIESGSHPSPSTCAHSVVCMYTAEMRVETIQQHSSSIIPQLFFRSRFYYEPDGEEAKIEPPRRNETGQQQQQRGWRRRVGLTSRIKCSSFHMPILVCTRSRCWILG